MSIRLRELIRAVRQCKTAQEERDVIAKESAALRQAFRENDTTYRHRNVAKLMYIHMLGYPTHFGQMETLKLIATNGFPEKRIGYLGLMILLDERQEVLMLVTNSLKNDLNQKNQYIVGLALSAFGNICSAEMARDLAPEVQRLMMGTNPFLKKKAALCFTRVIKKVPDVIEVILDKVPQLLNDRHHGVILGAVTLMLETCQQEPEAVDFYRKQVTPLCKILKTLLVSGFAPDHDVGGITDPFLQVKILRLLRMLGKGNADASDQMSDILAQVATNTEGNRNAGNAILYECVQTIMGVESIGGLRVLAINILGRFLSNRDNNIRYVALSTLAKVVAVDTQAVQRHRNTIVECVKDADVSIRRRALDLVYALVNEGNIKTLTKELLDYLLVCDLEFKPDLTNKICMLVQRFAPDKRWYIDSLLQVLVQAGAYVKEEVCRGLIIVITNATDLHGYAVRSLYSALKAHAEAAEESLQTVAVWSIGEYGELLLPGAFARLLEGEAQVTASEDEVLSIVQGVLKKPSISAACREYATTALMKLSDRLPHQAARIKAVIGEQTTSILLEVQQRSCEYARMFSHEQIRSQLLEHLPAVAESSYNANLGNTNIADTTPAAAPRSAGDDLLDLLGGEMLAAPPTANAANALSDLLAGDLFGGAAPAGTLVAGGLGDLLGGPAPVPVPSGATTAPPSSAADPLADLFGGAPTTASGTDILGGFGVAAPPAAPAFPSVVAFEKGGVSVGFAFSKPASNPSTTEITATYQNTNPVPVTDFTLQAAVPKFMQVRLNPATGTTLGPNGSSSAVQSLTVSNSMHGQKALVMRLRITYTINGTAVTEQCEVGNFPAGL